MGGGVEPFEFGWVLVRVGDCGGKGRGRCLFVRVRVVHRDEKEARYSGLLCAVWGYFLRMCYESESQSVVRWALGVGRASTTGAKGAERRQAQAIHHHRRRRRCRRRRRRRRRHSSVISGSPIESSDKYNILRAGGRDRDRDRDMDRRRTKRWRSAVQSSASDFLARWAKGGRQGAVLVAPVGPLATVPYVIYSVIYSTYLLALLALLALCPPLLSRAALVRATTAQRGQPDG